MGINDISWNVSTSFLDETFTASLWDFPYEKSWTSSQLWTKNIDGPSMDKHSKSFYKRKYDSETISFKQV